jgi:redox-sensitive bicupin YhaK (pirin superfamily)
MMQIRRAADRGRTRLSWLDSAHTFSFGDYVDPRHMGFRALRVLNEDRVAPSGGFGTHGHRDMEIISYVLEGALEHRDSLGNGSVLRPGELQRMTAGTGIRHSEFNPSSSEMVHFLQIWLLPERAGLAPGYEQKMISPAKNGSLRLAASRDGREGSLLIHQDVDVYLGTLEQGTETRYVLPTGRHAWLQVVRGTVAAGGLSLQAGDGLAVSDETALPIRARTQAEVMIFELA